MTTALPLFGPEVLNPYGEAGLGPWRNQVRDCKRCALSEGRTNTVFGEGDAEEPLVCFVGEGPGRQEDEAGRPFVGHSGQLLDRMIRAMGLLRSQVYLCNVVNCRPPDNRTPEKKEIQACSHYLFGQLRAVRPKAIVALGGTAAQTLLNSKKTISELRGRWGTWETIPVMPTFHPSHLLRAEDNEPKKVAWTDLQTVMEKVGLFKLDGDT